MLEPTTTTSVAITRAAAPSCSGPPTSMTSRCARSTGTCSPPTRPRPSGSTSTRGCDWLRATYGLPPTVVPPYWHRHDELVWELSALHTHWLNAYDPDGSTVGADRRGIATSPMPATGCASGSRPAGTKLDRDRPTRQTTWPGEEPAESGVEVVIEDRDADFIAFVVEDVAARRRIEERARAIARAS